MKLSKDMKAGLIALAALFLLLHLILPFRIPVLKLLITLGVAWAAWRWANPAPAKQNDSDFPGGRLRFSGVINEQRDENGVRLCRYVFSSAVLDLTDSASLPERIEIQAAFSSVSVRLPVDAAVTLRSSGAFCSISVPGQKCTVLGESACTCGSHDPNAPRISIESSCAFGSLSFKMG